MDILEVVYLVIQDQELKVILALVEHKALQVFLVFQDIVEFQDLAVKAVILVQEYLGIQEAVYRVIAVILAFLGLLVRVVLLGITVTFIRLLRKPILLPILLMR